MDNAGIQVWILVQCVMLKAHEVVCRLVLRNVLIEVLSHVHVALILKHLREQRLIFSANNCHDHCDSDGSRILVMLLNLLILVLLASLVILAILLVLVILANLAILVNLATPVNLVIFVIQ